MKLHETGINLTCSTFSLSCITASVSEEQTTGSSRSRLPPGSVLGQVSLGISHLLLHPPQGLTSFRPSQWHYLVHRRIRARLKTLEETTQDEQGPEEAARSQLRANTKVRAAHKSPDKLLTLASMFE